MYQDILQQAKQQGLQEGLAQVALNMFKEGIDFEKIVKITGLSTELLKRLQESGKIDVAETDPLADFIGAVSHGSLAQNIDETLYSS